MCQTMIIACVCAGCWRGSTPQEPTAGSSTTEAPTHAVKHEPPRCDQPNVGELDSYWNVKIPATYWVEMIPNGASWRPARNIPMPHHHATNLALANLADFSKLIDGAGRVRFIIEITSRDIQHDAQRQTWFTTYHARIIEACVLERS